MCCTAQLDISVPLNLKQSCSNYRGLQGMTQGTLAALLELSPHHHRPVVVGGGLRRTSDHRTNEGTLMGSAK